MDRGDIALAALGGRASPPVLPTLSALKEGEDADALLNSVRYYTLLRLHELVPARSYETLCLSIAADIGDKVLSKEYTERND
jgi:hypothetical protein